MQRMSSTCHNSLLSSTDSTQLQLYDQQYSASATDTTTIYTTTTTTTNPLLFQVAWPIVERPTQTHTHTNSTHICI